MNPRYHLSIGALCAAIASGSVVPIAGQTAAPRTTAPAASASSTPSRTPWGDPDLQGIYNYASTVPLERPAESAGRAELTRDEAEKRLEGRVQGQDAAPRTGDPGTYNAFWRDLVDLAAWGLVDNRTSLIVDPPDGKLPPLTPAAQRKVDEVRSSEAARARNARAQGEAPAESWEDFVLNDRCILWEIAGPPMFPGPYNNNVQIFQGPGYVAIHNEMVHEVRMIPLDGRPHVPANVRLLMGDSRGRWEGETLIVETTNFTAATNFRGTSENLQLIERFTRVGPDKLRYQFTVNDPTVYTRPWTAEIPMTKIQDMIYEYACHEGNIAMTSSLSGSRAQEKAAAEAGKAGQK